MHLCLIIQVIASLSDMLSTLLSLPLIDRQSLLNLFDGVEVFLFDVVAFDATEVLALGEGVYFLGGEVGEMLHFGQD